MSKRAGLARILEATLIGALGAACGAWAACLVALLWRSGIAGWAVAPWFVVLAGTWSFLFAIGRSRHK